MNNSDINLVPRKKRISPAVVGIVLILTAAVALLTVLGIFLPRYAMETRSRQLQLLNDELATYENVEVLYLEKMNELNSLKTRKQNYDDFVSSGRQVYDLMTLIRKSKPVALNITEQIYNENNTVITGIAANDLMIASFEDSLRKLEVFSDIRLETVSGQTGERVFTFTLMHFENQPGGGDN